MSVITTAHEKIDSVRESVSSAAKNITDVVVEGCWGSDDLPQEYIKKLEEILVQLLEIRRKLK